MNTRRFVMGLIGGTLAGFAGFAAMRMLLGPAVELAGGTQVARDLWRYEDAKYGIVCFSKSLSTLSCVKAEPR